MIHDLLNSQIKGTILLVFFTIPVMLLMGLSLNVAISAALGAFAGLTIAIWFIAPILAFILKVLNWIR